jgi:hypothetical protein
LTLGALLARTHSEIPVRIYRGFRDTHRASNDRGGTGDQALTIAQANNAPPTSSLPRCDCNGSLISNDAELTGVKETFSGHPHSLVGWQL